MFGNSHLCGLAGQPLGNCQADVGVGITYQSIFTFTGKGPYFVHFVMLVFLRLGREFLQRWLGVCAGRRGRCQRGEQLFGATGQNKIVDVQPSNFIIPPLQCHAAIFKNGLWAMSLSLDQLSNRVYTA